MHTLALSQLEHGLWFGANMAGLVTILTAVALLSTLVYLVIRIDVRVVTVRDTLKAAKANTANTALIPTVGDGVEAVLNEGLEHHLFLGRTLEKVRS